MSNTNQNKVCDEILEIMETYREQEASTYGVGTPGGLEHMGDVWRLLRKWEQLLKAPDSERAAGVDLKPCEGNGARSTTARVSDGANVNQS
jgi:hypothetical protein